MYSSPEPTSAHSRRWRQLAGVLGTQVAALLPTPAACRPAHVPVLGPDGRPSGPSTWLPAADEQATGTSEQAAGAHEQNARG